MFKPVDKTGQKQLSWQDFSSATGNRPQTQSLEATKSLGVRNALRALLEQYEESEFIKYLVAPSPEAMSGYFQCSVREIEEALEQLRRLGFEYEYKGVNHALVLWDPLIREKTVRRGGFSKIKLFYENMLLAPNFS